MCCTSCTSGGSFFSGLSLCFVTARRASSAPHRIVSSCGKMPAALGWGRLRCGVGGGGVVGGGTVEGCGRRGTLRCHLRKGGLGSQLRAPPPLSAPRQVCSIDECRVRRRRVRGAVEGR